MQPLEPEIATAVCVALDAVSDDQVTVADIKSAALIETRDMHGPAACRSFGPALKAPAAQAEKPAVSFSASQKRRLRSGGCRLVELQDPDPVGSSPLRNARGEAIGSCRQLNWFRH